jgi:hypothetical protein
MNQIEGMDFVEVQVAEEPPKQDEIASQASEQKKPVTPTPDKQKQLWKSNGHIAGAGLLV